ncbi:AMP-binding protein [Flavihumibacter sp. R14]|nr:AMP-binding protein [Flavihumibacter soli]
MNAFDFFFSDSKNLSKDFVLGSAGISFNQLFIASLKIAAYLKINVGERQNIILVSQNSVFFVVTYLAILKSGNTCIPISPSIEQSNFDYIVNSTGCKTVFVEDKTQLIKNPEIHFIQNSFVDNLLAIQDLPEDLFNDNFDNDRTALVLFTSGSTDRPKGVMLSHLNLTSNTESIVKYLNLTATDTMGVVLPFHYCYGLSLLHTHLKVGGSLVLINNFIFLASVIKDLKNFNCTGFAGVPSHFQILLRKFLTFTKTDFPHLRYVTQAGGKLHDVFIKEFKEAFPDIAFVVMYGQTEATARLAYLPSEMLHAKLGSIGKEIPGVTLAIVDDQLCEVKVGEVGEIAAKGDNIMKGYYGDPDATGEVLMNGWLMTGDLAMRDEDGFIFLVGRKKEIIKVGGRRVSPKEIEEVILTVQQTVDCTVEGIYDEILGEGIKASVVLKAGSDELNAKDEILKACNKNLSSFKIPQVICFENSLNVNTSGKKIKNVSVGR